MRWLKKIFRFFLNLCIALVIFLALLEVAFRNYWVDFYSAEFEALNTASDLSNRNGPTVLVGGDSFTGVQHSYVQTMRSERPNARIVNAGIPGTGVTEAACFLPDRIAEWQPEVFIYQIYVGNDLFDIRHPVGSEHIGTARKIYWWLSDRLRCVRYINYKLAQFRYRFTTEVGNAPSELNEEFSVETYAARQKMNFAAEPALVYNSAFLQEGRRADFEVLLNELDALMDALPDSCKSYLLVIPHCAQVSDRYARNMQVLGAQFPDDVDMLEIRNPLVLGLDSVYRENPRVELLSAQPFLQEVERKGNAIYYSDDPHLNELGHQMLGNVMAITVPE